MFTPTLRSKSNSNNTLKEKRLFFFTELKNSLINKSITILNKCVYIDMIVKQYPDSRIEAVITNDADLSLRVRSVLMNV